MKTLLSIVVIAIAITLTGCGKKETAAASTSTSPVAAITTAASTAVPADDPVDLAAIVKVAHEVATTPPDQTDGNDGEMQDPLTGLPMHIGQTRPDGYPPYAVTCSMSTQKCQMLNGMGNPIQTPIAQVGSMTAVRNADVLSRSYLCQYGICTDLQGNLVGRISTAMVKLHPELAH